MLYCLGPQAVQDIWYPELLGPTDVDFIQFGLSKMMLKSQQLKSTGLSVQSVRPVRLTGRRVLCAAQVSCCAIQHVLMLCSEKWLGRMRANKIVSD